MASVLTSNLCKVVSSSLFAFGVGHYVWRRHFVEDSSRAIKFVHSNERKKEKEVYDEYDPDVNEEDEYDPEDKAKKENTKKGKIKNDSEATTPDLTFEKIVGCGNVEEELSQYVEYLKSPELFKDLKVSMTKGCLLIGPTSSGKQTLAHTVAGAANVRLLDISEAFPHLNCPYGYLLLCNNKEVDPGEMFQMALENAPCVVFVKHIDVIMETCQQLVQQFLHEMDKVNINDEIVFIASVYEEPNDFDEKLMCRSGRFEHQVKITKPNFQERKELFTFFLRNITHDDTLDVDILSRRSDGYYIGGIKRLIDRSMIRVITKHRSAVAITDIEDLIDELDIGSEDRNFVTDKETLKGTAYHEAGHVLVRYYSDKQKLDPVYKVTIIKRGGTLGMTSFLPEPNKDFSKSRMKSTIDTSFGGMVAEELFLGKDGVTTGKQLYIEIHYGVVYH